MALNLIGVEFPLESIIGAAPLRLLGADKLYEYQNGNKTDTQIGMKYTVGEILTFQKFAVKVMGQNESAIPVERLQDKSKPIYVTFKDAVARTYRNNDNELDVSVRASAISEVKEPKV